MNIQKFLEEIASQEEQLLELCRNLIEIPSENPPGNEKAVAELIAEELTDLGFKVELVEPSPNRMNVLATLQGSGGGMNLLFNGHIDTVPVGDEDLWSVDPFKGVVKEGWIYGRGAADMKGALASLITAARTLRKLGVELKGNLLIHAVADEEAGSKFGTRYVAEKELVSKRDADTAVVMESSVFDGKIYFRNAVRGALWLEVITKGKSCHSSRPWQGINAVMKMVKILLALERHELKYKPHKVLAPPTIAPGTLINGGTKVNIIPAQCNATIDLRVLPGMTFDRVMDEIKAVINDLESEDPELKAELHKKIWWPPTETPENEEVVKVARNAVKEVFGYEMTALGGTGSTDSSWLKEISKIPNISFGPGDQKHSGTHGPDEKVEIEKLVGFAKIYGLMAIDICGV